MDRKGVLFEEILWVPNIFFLIVVVIVLFIIINSFTNARLDTSGIEPEVFVNRLIYSNNAINFCDDLRCYPGVIDYNVVQTPSLLQDRLDNSMHSSLDSKLVSFQATFYNETGGKIGEAYFNKDWFDRWKPLVFSNKYSETKRSLFVLYRDNETVSKGVLKIDLVMEVE
jgi:hypothetical protein